MTEERKQYIAQYAAKCEQTGRFPADQLYFWSLEDRLQFIDNFVFKELPQVRSDWEEGIECLHDLAKQCGIAVGRIERRSIRFSGFYRDGSCPVFDGLIYHHFRILSKYEQAIEAPPALLNIEARSKTPYAAKREGGDDWIVVTAGGTVSLGNKKWGRTFPVNQLIARLMWCEGRY